MATKKIRIPYNYEPRKYQLPLLRALDNGYKRAFALWHRRGGKDKTMLNYLIARALKEKGIYYYFLPTYKQGRSVIWDVPDMMKHFHPAFLAIKKGNKGLNSTEMKIHLINGSLIQIRGADKNLDSVRGTPPNGVIFSEFSFMNPQIWDIIRPILNENGGWALFNTTPNGDNAAMELFDLAKKNKDWFTQILTIRDTKRPDGTPVITDEMIQEERQMGMSEEMIQQEYYCSRDIGALGAYYAALTNQAIKENRIGKIAFFPDREINVCMDLGMSDDTVILFWQRDGKNIYIQNCFADNGKTTDFYIQIIKDYLHRKKGKLGTIFLPHDSNKRNDQTGKTNLQIYENEFGAQHIEKIPIKTKSVSGVAAGIQRVRAIFPFLYVNKENCAIFLKACKNYHKEWDDVKKIFRDVPLHDWSSHYMDALRYLAMAVDKILPEKIISDEEEDKLIFEVADFQSTQFSPF